MSAPLRRSASLLRLCVAALLLATAPTTPTAAEDVDPVPTPVGPTRTAGAGAAGDAPGSDAIHPPHLWGDDGFLPFPSDVYTVPDSSTPTGRRVALPASIWDDALIARAPFDVGSVLTRMAQLDGFSPNAPIIISIPTALAPGQVPEVKDSNRPLAAISIIDLSSHQRLRFRHAVIPRSEKGRDGAMLVLQPVDRLENARRYAVVVRRGLRDRAGREIAPPPGFQAGLEADAALPAVDPAAPGWRAYLRELGGILRSEGIDPIDLSFALAFTTESDSSLYRSLEADYNRIQDRAAAGKYVATGLSLHRIWLGGDGETAIRARGSFQILRFHDDRGRRLREPRLEKLRFLMELPSQCPPGGCGVAIFGHGLGATKETMFQVADRFAAEGIATIAVGTLHHTNPISPTRVMLGAKRNLDLLHGVMTEHVLRNLQVAELLRQDLATAARDYRLSRRAEPVQLRADRLFYIGQSLGGICGVATTAMSPWIRAGIFDVAGGSGIDLIFDSWVSRAMRLPLLKFPDMSPDEVNKIVPLAIYLFDDIDPLGFAPYVSGRPLPGRPQRYASQQAGRGDGLVPNWTSEKLARALGIPLVRAGIDAATPSTDAPGPGLRYFQLTTHWFMNHLELMKGQSSRAAADFLSWAWKRLEPEAVSSQHVEGTPESSMR